MNEREKMLAAIRLRAKEYAGVFADTPWHPDELSDMGWLGLVAVPWLLNEVEQQGKQGNDNGQPGADRIGPAQPPVQLVQAKQPLAAALPVVPSGNPFAQFFVGLFAKLKAVGFHAVNRNKSKV